jgi:hypothetical protein
LVYKAFVNLEMCGRVRSDCSECRTSWAFLPFSRQLALFRHARPARKSSFETGARILSNDAAFLKKR